MGKGDRRTRRGKIINGSFGRSRPARQTRPVAEAKSKSGKSAAKKAAAKSSTGQKKA